METNVMFLLCILTFLFTMSCNKIEEFASEQSYKNEFADNYKTGSSARLIQGMKSGLLKENFIFLVSDRNPNNLYSTVKK